MDSPRANSFFCLKNQIFTLFPPILTIFIHFPGAPLVTTPMPPFIPYQQGPQAYQQPFHPQMVRINIHQLNKNCVKLD